MSEKDDVDLLLGSALQNYAEAGPGLEQRVLACIAAASVRRPPRVWLPWAITLPAVACAFLLLFMLRNPQPALQVSSLHPSPPIAQSSRIDPTTRSPLPDWRPGRARSRMHAPAFRARKALPKLDLFPTPQPLTAEEQALVAVAAHSTPPQRRAIAEQEARNMVPLKISAISIPPIETTVEGKE